MELFFQPFAPAKALAPFVVQYLYSKSSFPEPYVSPQVPRGLPALIFFIKPDTDGYIEFHYPCRQMLDKSGVYLFGQATEVWWSRNLGNFFGYSVILHPAGVKAFLGESASEFANAIVPLSDLGIDCHQITEQLAACKNPLQQLPLLDAFLVRLFQRAKKRADEVDGALFTILKYQGLISLQEILTRERVGARTLHRKFTDQVGVTPKAYLRLIRFRSMMQHIHKHPQISWLDLTFRFGYYDQSHLIKDFHLFTGHSPVDYLQTNQSIDTAILEVL